MKFTQINAHKENKKLISDFQLGECFVWSSALDALQRYNVPLVIYMRIWQSRESYKKNDPSNITFTGFDTSAIKPDQLKKSQTGSTWKFSDSQCRNLDFPIQVDIEMIWQMQK